MDGYRCHICKESFLSLRRNKTAIHQETHWVKALLSLGVNNNSFFYSNCVFQQNMKQKEKRPEVQQVDLLFPSPSGTKLSQGQGKKEEEGMLHNTHSWYTVFGKYRVFAGNLQKRNWKIDTSMGPIGAQNLFSSLYKLGSNFLWIREI